MSTNLLELKGVHTHIEAYHILHGVDLAIPKGQLTMLLDRSRQDRAVSTRPVAAPPATVPAA